MNIIILVKTFFHEIHYFFCKEKGAGGGPSVQAGVLQRGYAAGDVSEIIFLPAGVFAGIMPLEPQAGQTLSC